MENFSSPQFFSNQIEKICDLTTFAFDKVSKLAERGVIYLLLILGGGLVLFAIIVRLVKDLMSQTDFIITIVVGTFILILGAGIRVYQLKTDLDLYKWQQEFNANLLSQLKNTATDITKAQQETNKNVFGQVADATKKLFDTKLNPSNPI